MIYPFDNLTAEQQLKLFGQYWKVYCDELAGHFFNGTAKPGTFRAWWDSLPGLKFNF